MQSIREQDWLLFRERYPEWQERYLREAVAAYQKILDSDTTASNKFWKLEMGVSSDSKLAAVQLPYRMSRSMVAHNLRVLLKDGSICEADLEGFSRELRRAVTEIPPLQ